MAKKPANTPRRAPKRRFANQEYYPKVDLSDLEDRPRSSWSISGVLTPAEAAAGAPTVETPIVEAPLTEAPVAEAPVVEAQSASEEKVVMSSPVAISQPPAAEPKPIPAASGSSSPAKDALCLPGSLDLPAARPLANSLINRRGQPIVIDASSVTSDRRPMRSSAPVGQANMGRRRICRSRSSTAPLG